MVVRDQAALLDRMLDAAEVVVVRQGIANLTLEAVAAEAGLSKGGLLHHFPNKDRLDRGDGRPRGAEPARLLRERVLARAGSAPAGWLAASSTTASRTPRAGRISSGAAPPRCSPRFAHKPALIEPMRAVYSDLYKRLEEDDLPPGAAEAIAAAADGLWLNWVLGLVPVDQSAHDARADGARTAAPATIEPARPARKSRNVREDAARDSS